MHHSPRIPAVIASLSLVTASSSILGSCEKDGAPCQEDSFTARAHSYDTLPPATSLQEALQGSQSASLVFAPSLSVSQQRTLANAARIISLIIDKSDPRFEALERASLELRVADEKNGGADLNAQHPLAQTLKSEHRVLFSAQFFDDPTVTEIYRALTLGHELFHYIDEDDSASWKEEAEREVRAWKNQVDDCY